MTWTAYMRALEANQIEKQRRRKRFVVHNHGIDPSCQERQLPGGQLRGQCLPDPPIADREVEPMGSE